MNGTVPQHAHEHMTGQRHTSIFLAATLAILRLMVGVVGDLFKPGAYRTLASQKIGGDFREWSVYNWVSIGSPEWGGKKTG